MTLVVSNYSVPYQKFDWSAGHAVNLISGLIHARDSRSFTDVILECLGGRVISVHGVILATASKHFALKLSKSKSMRISAKEFKPETIRYLVDFMYAGKLTVPQEEAEDFLAAGKKYGVVGLDQENVVKKMHEITEDQKDEKVVMERKEENKTDEETGKTVEEKEEEVDDKIADEEEEKADDDDEEDDQFEDDFVFDMNDLSQSNIFIKTGEDEEECDSNDEDTESADDDSEEEVSSVATSSGIQPKRKRVADPKYSSVFPSKILVTKTKFSCPSCSKSCNATPFHFRGHMSGMKHHGQKLKAEHVKKERKCVLCRKVDFRDHSKLLQHLGSTHQLVDVHLSEKEREMLNILERKKVPSYPKKEEKYKDDHDNKANETVFAPDSKSAMPSLRFTDFTSASSVLWQQQQQQPKMIGSKTKLSCPTCDVSCFSTSSYFRQHMSTVNHYAMQLQEKYIKKEKCCERCNSNSIEFRATVDLVEHLGVHHKLVDAFLSGKEKATLTAIKEREEVRSSYAEEGFSAAAKRMKMG